MILKEKTELFQNAGNRIYELKKYKKVPGLANHYSSVQFTRDLPVMMTLWTSSLVFKQLIFIFRLLTLEKPFYPA